MTTDRVRVKSNSVLEIDLGSVKRQDDRVIEANLTKVIASLVDASLTPQQVEALKINVPNFTVR